MRCPHCGWKYPESFLNTMFINEGQPMCGICALGLQNEIQVASRTTFRGPMAESLRISAIVWRMNHLADAPILN